MDEATSNLMEPLKSVEPKPDSLEGKIVEEARQAEQETSTDLPPGQALAETQDSIQAEEGKGLPEIKVGWTWQF